MSPNSMPNLETKWTLPTPDGKTIYGVKNSAGKGAKSAIFMVHGLASNIYDYNFKRAADYFSENGYDVFRISLYSGEKNGRILPECTLVTHGEDLNTVLSAYAKKYQKVFLIGHSYGGPSVMLANPSGITATSLWDPSFNTKQVNIDFAEAKKLKVGDYDTINWGIVMLIGKSMVKHADSLDEAACTQLAKAFKSPVQVVMAGNGYYVKKPFNYDTANQHQHRRDVVEGTQHCFHEGQTCEDLLAKTHNWFKSF